MNTEIENGQGTPFELAQRVKQAHEASLLEKENVIGVGIGLRKRGGEYTDEVVLVVMVKKKLPATQLSSNDLLPLEIEGVPVDVQELGEIRAGV
jgi:hypothetical protein